MSAGMMLYDYRANTKLRARVVELHTEWLNGNGNVRPAAQPKPAVRTPEPPPERTAGDPGGHIPPPPPAAEPGTNVGPLVPPDIPTLGGFVLPGDDDPRP